MTGRSGCARAARGWVLGTAHGHGDRATGCARAARARVLLALAVAGAAACSERIPTAVESGELFPVSARTVEIRLPSGEFVRQVRVLGGFGSPADLGHGLVARAFEDALQARTLARFASFPRSASVRDSAGTTRTDSLLTFVGGRLVVHVDTAAAAPAPVVLVAGVLMVPWQAESATWVNAVDTVGVQRAWPQPGAGPVIPVGQGTWTPGQGDSVVIAIDSATIALWGDTARAERGVRLDAETEGVRVRLRSVALRLLARPSVRRDTTIILPVGVQNLTFIYDPPPAPPAGELRVGGAPAWRSVLVLDVPREFGVGHAVCARIACPLRLDSANLTYAALVVRTRPTPAAFRPDAALSFELRPVLRPERLPKAPLGSLVDPPPSAVAATAFTPGAEREVSIPLTRFVRDHLRGETAEGLPPSNAVALLAGGGIEPQEFGFASFTAAGADGPELRLVVTVMERLGLP